jgi:type I restriction enzyme, S subunit
MNFLKSIEEICTLVTDGTHYTPSPVKNGVPFLTVKDMLENGLDLINCSCMSEEDFKIAFKGNSTPQIGDVLFSKDGTVGKVHVVNEKNKFAILSSIALLRPDINQVDNKYLAHMLKAPQTLSLATSLKTGSALRRIILKDLKKLTIPLPPLPEQKRIAAILDKADALRRKRQETIRLADEFLRSVFLEMFGDPVRNEKGWEQDKLGNRIEIVGGFAFESGKFVEQGIPIIKIGTVNKGYFDTKSLSFWPFQYDAKLKKYEVYPDDVLVTMTGTVGKDDYGNVCLATNFYPKYLLNQRVAKLLSYVFNNG